MLNRLIFASAPAYYVHLLFPHEGCCKFARLRKRTVQVKRYFSPFALDCIQNPEIIELLKKLASEYHEILIDDLSAMVRSLPRHRVYRIEGNFLPLEISQIKLVD